MHNTKPSIDMIKKCLDEAYASGIGYDLSDMKGPVIALAASSTNQAETCMKIVGDMKFKSEDVNETVNESDSDCLVFMTSRSSQICFWFVIKWQEKTNRLWLWLIQNHLTLKIL